MSEEPPAAVEDPVDASVDIAKRLLDTQVQLPAELSSEHEPTSAAPFMLKLTQADKPAFTSVMEKVSLMGMVRGIRPLALLHEKRIGTFSDPERKIIELFGNLAEQQKREGRDFLDMDLQFRWVSASPDVTVDKIVETAPIWGGNPPADKSGWAHVGQSVVEDFMANPVHNDPGVLFVYDGSKLTPITQEDMDAAWENPEGKHAYMHAQKPIPGLELKDTLVGMISFDG